MNILGIGEGMVCSGAAILGRTQSSIVWQVSDFSKTDPNYGSHPRGILSDLNVHNYTWFNGNLKVSLPSIVVASDAYP